jgi:nicotinate-nucleotide adenylyltransferase
MIEFHPSATAASFPVRERRALFGGTFDPVHRGHLAMATAARDAVGLSRVIFLPCFVSPFKNTAQADPEERLAMLELALDELDGDWAEASDYELKRPGPSYSWETAHHFAEVFPQIDWYWILGTDQWEQIEAWAEPERLRLDLHFLVCTREGTPVRKRAGWRATALDFDHPASASAIRNDWSLAREWVTPAVRRYAEERRIYGS